MYRSVDSVWAASAFATAVVAWMFGLFLEDGSWLKSPVLLAATTAVLISLAAVALRIRGALGSLVLILTLYLALGYVARPLVLIWLNPQPRLGDSLSDRRISSDYSGAISEIMERVLPGFLLLLILIFALRRFSTVGSSGKWVELVRSDHGLVLLSLGWLVRIYATFAGSEGSSALVTLTYLPTVAAGLIIVGADRLRRPTLIVVLLSEGTWALVAATKAPVMAVLVFAVIRIFMRGEKVRLAAVAIYTSIAVGMFFAVQRVKTELGRLNSTELVQSYYPPVVEALYPILARFDALQANVDAELAGPYSYLPLGEVFARIWQALIPQQLVGEKRELAGAAWGSVLRPQASGPAQAGANLAEGPVAEGWVLAGWIGIGFEMLFLTVAIIVVARLFQSHYLFAVAFAVSMTAQPYLFERGMLAITEGIGKSLQLAALASVLLLLLGASGRRSINDRRSTQYRPYLQKMSDSSEFVGSDRRIIANNQ